MGRTATTALDRRSLVAPLTGTILEIGPGRGTNLAHYGPAVRWIGVEPAVRKHRRIQAAARNSRRQVTVHAGTAEDLPLTAASVDGVVATFVLCSVDDVARSLQEIRRVLRPGCPFVFLEHVGAPAGTASRRLQDGWARLGIAQCRPNRDTGAMIERAGFTDVDYSSSELRSLGVRVPVMRGTAVVAH